MKRITGSILAFTIMFLLSGCGATIPDLSEEQSDLVTEYAAGLMIKYNSLPEESLLNETQLVIEEQKEVEIKEKEKKKEEAQKAYLAAKEAEEKGDSQEGADGNTAEAPKQDPTIDDLASFYGLDGFSVFYTGYELCKSYPDESRDDFFLAMDATAGKQLCIIQFNVSNISGEDKDFDMFAKQGVFFLSIDGQDTIQAQSTLLLDDLAVYKGVIASGAQEPMILVFEVDESIQQMGTLELTARNGSEKGTIILQ